MYNHCTINVVGVVASPDVVDAASAAEDLIVDLASATWLKPFGYLPHLLLAHKVLKVVKEANDAFVSPKWICAKVAGNR